MNSYGNMKESLRRNAAYQQVGCEFMPGYGSSAFRLTVEDGAKRVSDVFYIYNDADLNAAINKLYGRL